MNNREYKKIILPYCMKWSFIVLFLASTVYHIGASIMDLGCKMTAFSVLNFVTKEQLLEMIK